MTLRPWPFPEPPVLRPWPASLTPPSNNSNSDGDDDNAERLEFNWGPPAPSGLWFWAVSGPTEIEIWSINPGLPRDRFIALIPLNDFEAIVPGLRSPNDNFRQPLIEMLWRFYHDARDADAMVSRSALKRQLKNALKYAPKLKAAVEALAKSQEPTVSNALSPYAALLDEHRQHPGTDPRDPGHQGRAHPSGIGLVAVLDHFERDMKPVNDSLPPDPGGNRHAVAFVSLAHGLKEWRRTWVPEHRRRSVSKFVKAVVDVLRGIERTLQEAERELGRAETKFKLPNSLAAIEHVLFRKPKARNAQKKRRKKH